MKVIGLGASFGVVVLALSLAGGASGQPARPPAAAPPHNVVIFIADGLRYGSVDAASAPNMAAVRAQGVDFQNSHSLFPTLTTPNASAIATGHGLGDTGDFGNVVYVGAPPLKAAFLSQTPFLEDDPVLGDMNARFGGDYLGEPSLLQAARAAGLQTAAIGKLGPTAIQDVTARDGRSTLVIDDLTGQPEGLPLPPDVAAAIKAAGLDPTAPDRGLNTDPGNDEFPGVVVANVEQQNWFAHVATDVVLPRFAKAGKPFVLVFWSRDPDGTQHNQGDSLNTLTPGINGPTSKAAVKNADTDLGRLRAALARLGLEATTDIVVTSDHGFSTTSKQSATSPSARRDYPDVQKGYLPPGFLALDLGQALGLAVYEPNGLDLAPLNHPKHASAVLGPDPHRPLAVVGANGGMDEIWLPTGTLDARRRLARRIVAAAEAQDYTAAVFVRDALGSMPGALPTSAIGLNGSARTPPPDVLVDFRSGVIAGCPASLYCAFDVADTELQQGQGMHGDFSRANTRNMMAATGPDFRKGFADTAPAGNGDWAPTLAHVLGLKLDGPGTLTGRVMREALAGGDGQAPHSEPRVTVSAPGVGGFVTRLRQQVLDGRVYGDTAGAPGRVFTGEP